MKLTHMYAPFNSNEHLLDSMLKNNSEKIPVPHDGTPEMAKTSVWKRQVHASFKKVVAFDLLFMLLGALIGAGIITAVMR
jgi:hypothetical protein